MSSIWDANLINERSNKQAFLLSERIIYCNKIDFDEYFISTYDDHIG